MKLRLLSLAVLIAAFTASGFSWFRLEQRNATAPLRPLTEHYNSSLGCRAFSSITLKERTMAFFFRLASIIKEPCQPAG